MRGCERETREQDREMDKIYTTLKAHKNRNRERNRENNGDTVNVIERKKEEGELRKREKSHREPEPQRHIHTFQSAVVIEQ